MNPTNIMSYYPNVVLNYWSALKPSYTRLPSYVRFTIFCCFLFFFFFFPLLNSSSLNAIAVMPVVQRSVKGPMWLHFLIGVSTFLLSDLLWLRAIAKSVSKYFWILDSYGHSFGVIEIVRVCTILVNIRYWHCSLTWGIKKKLFCTNIRVPTL